MNCPHCGVHVDEHPENACFNAWVATGVMEIDSIRRHDKKGPGRVVEAYAVYSDDSEDGYAMYWLNSDFYNYSGHIAAAWRVVEKVLKKDVLARVRLDSGSFAWTVWVSNKDISTWASGETAPLAICRAAIKATKESEL